MLEILPFRALRYDACRYPIEKLVTQPYDKITPEMQAAYYAASPYNLVRIILGRAQPDDSQKENTYTRAAACLRQWRSEKILVQDRQPCIYVYSEEFTVPQASGGAGNQVLRRSGFIALGKIYDYSEGIVFRHEQTLSRPKADRLNLLRATRAHFGQIFMLYSDPAAAVDKLLEKALRAGEGDGASLQDEYGVRHQLSPIADPAIISAVQKLMAGQRLIIADGHHRYETALAYRNERRQAQGAAAPSSRSSTAGAAFDYLMMTFINMEAEGLVVLPTHRVVSGLISFDEQKMFAAAASSFHIEELDPGLGAEELLARLKAARGASPAFLAVTAAGVRLLRGRSPGPERLAKMGLSPNQQKLDIIHLHKVLLEAVLGMSEESIRNQEHVSYLRDASEAIARARGGQANVAFLMNPVRMQQLRDVAFAGEVMPQKSTDFYPKLLSGLTIYALD